jgi:hypothetical protein
LVRSQKNVVLLHSFFLPPWELLSHRYTLGLHQPCWSKWRLRQRYMDRVKASGKYLLQEDGTWVHGAEPYGDWTALTVAEGRIHGVFRPEAGQRCKGKRWSATVWLDYLEMSRYRPRFWLTCFLHQWGSGVVVDVPAPDDRSAVLQQAMQTVTRRIEATRIGSWLPGSPHPRSCLFRVSRAAWLDAPER